MAEGHEDGDPGHENLEMFGHLVMAEIIRSCDEHGMCNGCVMLEIAPTIMAGLMKQSGLVDEFGQVTSAKDMQMFITYLVTEARERSTKFVSGPPQ